MNKMFIFKMILYLIDNNTPTALIVFYLSTIHSYNSIFALVPFFYLLMRGECIDSSLQTVEDIREIL